VTTDAAFDLSEDLVDELAASSIVDPRTVPVRFSRLKNIARSALHYWDSVQSDNDPTIAMRFGSGVHAMVLGEPFIVWPGKDRRAKGYKEFAVEHADKAIMTRSEASIATALFSAITAHPLAGPLLFGEGAIMEQQIEWQWMGRDCTSRPDSRIGSEVLIDLKTTQSAEPAKFERDAVYRGYHAQLAFYELAIEYSTGSRPKDSYIVAVESKRPYAITVLRLTDEARDHGLRLCRTWFERLRVCEESNVWPGYSESVCPLGLLDGDINITIDGIPFNEE
jgi:hypothetical protein